MKKIKRIFSLFLSVIVALGCFAPLAVYAESSSEESFGSRIISYQMSFSDLENYADGGRSGLDISLRSKIPENIDYEFKAENRRVVLSLSFDFENLEDYRKKVVALCGPDTAVIFSDDGELLLIESSSAMDYLDFLFESDTENEQNQSVADIRSMMSVTKNLLRIGDEEYKVDDLVNIRPNAEEDTDKIKADYLLVETEGKRDGSFKRSVTVGIKNDFNEEKTKYFNKLLKKLGKVKKEQISDNELTLCVTFEAYGQKELASKTEQCLGCQVVQMENMIAIDKKTVGVTSQEFFDISTILESEAVFSYLFAFPSYYDNVEPISGCSFLLENNTVSSSSEVVAYNYEKKFCFEEIVISTDVSDVFGKIERKIILSVSDEIADFYHENIKSKIGERLPKNSVMTITKTTGRTDYEIVFSANSSEAILEFTDTVLDTSGTLTIEQGFLGLSNRISETIAVDNILTSMSPCQKVSINYSFLSGATLDAEMEEYEGSFEFQNSNFLQKINGDNGEINVSYNAVNIFHVFILIFIIAGLGVCAFFVFKKVRKITKKEMQDPQT